MSSIGRSIQAIGSYSFLSLSFSFPSSSILSKPVLHAYTVNDTAPLETHVKDAKIRNPKVSSLGRQMTRMNLIRSLNLLREFWTPFTIPRTSSFGSSSSNWVTVRSHIHRAVIWESKIYVI